jgi:hypothetical protein
VDKKCDACGKARPLTDLKKCSNCGWFICSKCGTKQCPHCKRWDTLK